MKSSYPWLSLREIAKYEPEMVRLKVSLKARSNNGFLTAYKQARGNPDFMSSYWKMRRVAFIKRFMALYKQYGTNKIWLALVAWAYRPDRRFG
jgi:hypothetical protein